MMTTPRSRGAICLSALLLLIWIGSGGPANTAANAQPTPTANDAHEIDRHEMQIHYLEIVTPDVDESCHALTRTLGVTFGDPIPELGNARTAELASGGHVGVRAPMHDAEKPAVRPYALVDDIEAALRAAQDAGATLAVPPMQIPGRGRCAIYVLGGVEHGLWQR